jgi:hypothetical protein
MATGTPISNNINNKVNRNRVVIFLLRRLGVTGVHAFRSYWKSGILIIKKRLGMKALCKINFALQFGEFGTQIGPVQ